MSQNKTILLVDDNPVNLGLLEEMLTNQGCSVCLAFSGYTAIDKAREIQPDLILLDVAMPDLDGFEVMQMLKADESTRNIPVMFITALIDSEDIVRGISLGAADYITKPFLVEDTLARINRVLKI